MSILFNNQRNKFDYFLMSILFNFWKSSFEHFPNLSSSFVEMQVGFQKLFFRKNKK